VCYDIDSLATAISIFGHTVFKLAAPSSGGAIEIRRIKVLRPVLAKAAPARLLPYEWFSIMV
jgi:hypothetical protein